MSDKKDVDKPARPSSLTDIVVESQRVINLIIESGGEITPEVEQVYNELQAQFIHKVDSCYYVIKKLDSDAEFFKKQSEFYQRIAKGIETSKVRIKDMIKSGMIALEKTEVSGDLSRFCLQKIADKLIIDETKLPGEYKTIVQTIVPDREKILSDLKAGKEIEGAKLIENFALRDYASKRK
jgi:hypothetical protein